MHISQALMAAIGVSKVPLDGKDAVVRSGNDAPGCAAPAMAGGERTGRVAFSGPHHG
ncbi:hypothetical protein [Rhizobium binae]|nr:hypothetical protein [Rhizobium binae]MBX4966778.1 hypothetical protein [Rhizobium binae]